MKTPSTPTSPVALRTSSAPRTRSASRRVLFGTLSASVLAASLALAGCSGGGEAVGPKDPTSQTTAPLAVSATGPTRLVAEALAEVPLRADQRTQLETLLKDAETRHAALGEKRKAIGLAVADMVEKGAVDDAALKSQTDALDTELQAALAKDREAIGQAHALLDKTQRHALVEAIKTRGKEAWKKGALHGRGHGDGHGPADGEQALAGEHGEGHGPGRFAHHGPPGGPGGFAGLKELNLTDAQKEQMKAAFETEMQAHRAARGDEARGPEGKEHGPHGRFGGMRKAKEALESFERDDFDAKTTLGAGAPGFGGRGGPGLAGGMVRFAKQVTPILTPEQRVVAAKHLRARATHEGFGPGAPPPAAPAPAAPAPAGE